MKPILIVDNEEKFCKVVKTALDLENFSADYVLSGEEALEWLMMNSSDIVLTDLRMDGITGLDLLKILKKKYPQIDVLIMTAFATQKTAVDALREGALDYLIKPFEMDELILRVKRIVQQKKIQNENRLLKSQSKTPVYFDRIFGRSNKMKEVYRLIQKASESDSTVLIRGESGTGKELVAETIHSNSARKDKSFIAINCAAVPDTLLESELFGYEKGAFTGATQRKLGKFEFAQEGTIFLDEIGDLNLSTQAKLLRVLQNKEISRLGGNERIKVNSRVIAATHRNLEEMVEKGEFREDLYYRLNVFPIHIPPLRERKEDIPELINHFLRKTNTAGIDHSALRILMDYQFPGNVRELENVIERASILTDSIILKENLPALNVRPELTLYNFEIPDEGLQLDQFEKFLIEQALHKSGGNKTRAAELLGITRRRLYSIMDRFGVSS